MKENTLYGLTLDEAKLIIESDVGIEFKKKICKAIYEARILYNKDLAKPELFNDFHLEIQKHDFNQKHIIDTYITPIINIQNQKETSTNIIHDDFNSTTVTVNQPKINRLISEFSTKKHESIFNELTPLRQEKPGYEESPDTRDFKLLNQMTDTQNKTIDYNCKIVMLSKYDNHLVSTLKEIQQTTNKTMDDTCKVVIEQCNQDNYTENRIKALKQYSESRGLKLESYIDLNDKEYNLELMLQKKHTSFKLSPNPNIEDSPNTMKSPRDTDGNMLTTVDNKTKQLKTEDNYTSPKAKKFVINLFKTDAYNKDQNETKHVDKIEEEIKVKQRNTGILGLGCCGL